MLGTVVRACVGIWGTQTPSPGVISPSPPARRATWGCGSVGKTFTMRQVGNAGATKPKGLLELMSLPLCCYVTSPVGLAIHSSAFGYLRLGAFALGHWQSFELHLEHGGPGMGSAAAALPHHPAPRLLGLQPLKFPSILLVSFRSNAPGAVLLPHPPGPAGASACVRFTATGAVKPHVNPWHPLPR